MKRSHRLNHRDARRDRAAAVLQAWWRRYNPRRGWNVPLLRRALRAAAARKRRQGRIKDILLYVVFIVMFQLASLAEIGDQDLFHMGRAVQRRFDAEFAEADAPTRRRSFRQVETVAHWHQWLSGPFLDAVYESGDGAILGYNRLVGGVAVSQIRMQDRAQCGAERMPGEWTDPAPLSCYGTDGGDYAREFESRADFGALEPRFEWRGWNGTDTAARRDRPFTYLRTRFNTVLPAGGYTVVLPRADRARAEALVEHLVQGHYVDLQTRALVVELTLLNAMLNRLLVVRMVAEVPKGGGLLTTYQSVAPSPHLPLAAPEMGTRAFVTIEILFYAFFIAKEVRRVNRIGLGYFRQLDKIFHNTNLVLYIVVWALRLRALSERPADIAADGDGFVDFVPYGELQELAVLTNACNAFLCWFKVVTYLAMSPRFGILTDTLIISAGAVGGFMLIFAIVTYGYALAYLMSFGSEISGCRNVAATLFTLLKALLGDFDMDALIGAHFVMGPLMFVAFIGVGLFVILNMLIAIISSAYDVALDRQLAKDNFSFADDVRAYLLTLPLVADVLHRTSKAVARVVPVEGVPATYVGAKRPSGVAAKRVSGIARGASGGGDDDDADEGFAAVDDALLERQLAALASKHRAVEEALQSIEDRANLMSGGSFRFTGSSMFQLPVNLAHMSMTLDESGVSGSLSGAGESGAGSGAGESGVSGAGESAGSTGSVWSVGGEIGPEMDGFDS